MVTLLLSAMFAFMDLNTIILVYCFNEGGVIRFFRGGMDDLYKNFHQL